MENPRHIILYGNHLNSLPFFDGVIKRYPLEVWVPLYNPAERLLKKYKHRASLKVGQTKHR